MTSIPITQNKEHDIPSQILKTTLDYMRHSFLDPNVCGFWYISMLAWSQTLGVNWQKYLFIFH